MVEVNASVLGNYEHQKVSVLEEVMTSEEFLTYADKYIGGNKTKSCTKGMESLDRVIPARINKDLTKEVECLAKKTFRALNLTGVCRLDFMIDKKDNKVYVNEPTTIPGSLSFYLWDKVGLEYNALLDELITLAIKDYKNKEKKTYSFDTNILSGFNGLKGSKGMKGKLR